MLNLIKHPKWMIKRHLNQIQKIYPADIDQHKEEPMTVIYDMFNIYNQYNRINQVSENEFQQVLWK